MNNLIKHNTEKKVDIKNIRFVKFSGYEIENTLKFVFYAGFFIGIIFHKLGK